MMSMGRIQCLWIEYACHKSDVLLISMSVYFFFQAEDGIRDLVRSRGLGDVYKRQIHSLDAADCR